MKIKHVCCTLGRITQTVLFQTIKLLESFSLNRHFMYDEHNFEDFVRDATGVAKVFTNLNMISSDRWGRHELHGIVKTLDGLNGGLRGHIG
jgi:hypothetical protein